MAGMGPPPAENRRRTNLDTFEEGAVTVPADAQVEAPELPGWEGYRTETLRWYNTWTSAPQAAAFTVTDWQRLHMLAPLVDAYWAAPRKELLAEIRLNESLLGATHLDRLRARIKLGKSDQKALAAAQGVADLTAARRKRMSDAS